MSEEAQIECIREVFKILVDQCNRYSDCMHCPFEKQMDGGYGACKFRLATGYPAWQLFEIFKGNIEEE